MRVKSVNRSSFGVVIAMAAIFFLASFNLLSDRTLRTKQVNLMIRQLGHQLLLQSGDRTSAVPPVAEITSGTFLLEFDNQLTFTHDSLIAITRKFFPVAEFPAGYTVTVHDCVENQIVYGFKVDHASPDLLPCVGRIQPAGCYTIQIALPDLATNSESTHQLDEKRNQSRKNARSAHSKLEDNSAIGDGSTETRATVEIRSPITEFQNSERPEELTTTTLVSTVISSGMLVLLAVTFVVGRFRKTSSARQKPAANIQTFFSLGKFQFDLQGQRLLIGQESVSLTDKETKILELLNNNFGELVTRETLMDKIWISEGVITGRSLDMFVSKLRKKLSADHDLRITNIHGKGYKLEKVS